MWSSVPAQAKAGGVQGCSSARESPDEGIQTDSGTDVWVSLRTCKYVYLQIRDTSSDPNENAAAVVIFNGQGDVPTTWSTVQYYQLVTNKLKLWFCQIFWNLKFSIFILQVLGWCDSQLFAPKKVSPSDHFLIFGLGWLTPATIAFQMRDPNDFLSKNWTPPNLISCTLPLFFPSFQIHLNFIFAAGREFWELQWFATETSILALAWGSNGLEPGWFFKFCS